MAAVDVRIGVTQTPREIEVELADGADVDALIAEIEKSVGSGQAVVWFTDRRGRKVGVPSDKLAYVELNTASEERRVGFGAAVR